MSAFRRGLEAFRRLLDGPAEWQLADRALTLQMLSTLGSHWFERASLQEELDRAMAELRKVPTSFEDSLPLDIAMSRLDALYLCQINGLSVQDFDREQLTGYIETAEATYGLLPAWLMGEQAHALGVRARRLLPSPFPFADQNWLLHLYHLTHILMLESDYFLRPGRVARRQEELAQLERAVPPLIAGQMWDLLAEAQMCFRAGGRFNQTAHAALRLAQKADGSWAEKMQGKREIAHTTAACLVAVSSDAREFLEEEAQRREGEPESSLRRLPPPRLPAPEPDPG